MKLHRQDAETAKEKKSFTAKDAKDAKDQWIGPGPVCRPINIKMKSVLTPQYEVKGARLDFLKG